MDGKDEKPQTYIQQGNNIMTVHVFMYQPTPRFFFLVR